MAALTTKARPKLADVLHFPAVSLPGAGPADAAERERALDATRSFLIEAPAGSGKTGLLIQRFLKLLAGKDISDPAQVLAITFTRKATGELRARVLGQLLDAQAGVPTRNSFDAATRPLAQAVLARDATLGWSVLEQPSRLNIRTIDGVTSAIARALPVLAGDSAGLSPAEDAAPLHAEAAHRTLMRLGGADAELSHALEFLLLHRDGDLADVADHLAGMLCTREQWGPLLAVPLTGGAGRSAVTDAWLDGEVLPRLERALDRAICRTLTQAAKTMPAGALATLSELAAILGHAAGYRDAPSPLAFCAGRPEPPAEMAQHLDHWRALANLLITRSSKDWRGGFNVNQVGFAMTKEQKAELKEMIENLRAHDAGSDCLCKALCAIHELPSPIYPAEQWQLTRALFRVLGQSVIDLGQVFRERGKCDFIEPAVVARAALQSDLAAATLEANTGSSLRHLLVDEMQDTSSGQYELIELLTRGWNPEAGQTVFLVGDPKQSIYLFRQARVERFVRTLTTGRLGTEGVRLESLLLTANFRSTPALVQAFNDDFSRIFPAQIDPAHPEEVPFHPATASRAPSSTETAPDLDAATTRTSRTPVRTAARTWHTTLLPYTADSETRQALRRNQRQLDAAAMLEIVRTWQARPLPADRAERKQPWRIAVLVRSRNQVAAVVEEFRRAGIPTRATDIDPLAERQEVLDLIALTRALNHPADRTAWLAVLRAPWCGLTLADLHQIAGADDVLWRQRTILDAIASRADLLSADGHARLQPVHAILLQAMARTGRMPLSAQVEQTWRALNGAASASAEELANAERFFALLDQLVPGSSLDLDLDTLATRIEKLYAAPGLTPGAVEIATIHSAKGLEWDVVLVPALDQAAPGMSNRLLNWIELDPDGDPLTGEPLSLFAPIQAKGTQSEQLNEWMRGLHKAREAAERKRLFYVVATRAREELHLFASPAATSKGEPCVATTSLLHAAWRSAEEHFKQPPALTAIFETPAIPAVSLALAAAADAAAADAAPAALVERIPQAAISAAAPPAAPATAPRRPEGSFATRIVGNTLHSLLDYMAQRLASGIDAAALATEVKSWSPRIRNLLLAGGLGPAELPAAVSSVLRGLHNTLNDAEGQWHFNPHSEAASEFATVDISGAGEIRSVRIDRTFLAGSAPGLAGTNHRWIVDIKTGTHGTTGLETWLLNQRELYNAQLERYAEALTEPSQPICLGLYFPMLPKLIWWMF